MSFFPIIPSTSLHSSILALPPPHHDHNHNHDQTPTHHAIHMDHLPSLLSHLLAPVSHTQCTSSMPCSTPPPLSESHPHQEERKERETHIIRLAEEEELARLQHGEQDGTPLCREEGIATWHQHQHQYQHQHLERNDSMEAQKKSRRGSLEWLAGVIKERKGHA